MRRHYFFIGIGGSGMSGLAQIIRAQGNLVSGSDRNFDYKRDQDIFSHLQSQDIKLFPQDGSGLNTEIDEVIISGAIEDDNPDLKKARVLSLPVISRSEFLSQIFNASRGIAVAGTSGKSTITAMAAKIMDGAHLDPTVINGAIIPDYKNFSRVGNAKLGSTRYMLIETDESDGSIVKFYPEIGILANISKDHKPIPELIPIFSHFIKNTKDRVIVNADCSVSRGLISLIPRKKILTFGFNNGTEVKAEEVTLSVNGSSFKVHDTLFSLSVPGRHNISNALAAIALGIKLEIPLLTISQALKRFKGLERRLEMVGETRGIKVFDDFSHNAAKISAAIETLRSVGSRLILVYQPHGFGPTKLLKDELVETFNTKLSPGDILILLDIYYAGGTADRSISSADLVRDVHVTQAENLKDRDKVISRTSALSKPGDVIVVMGARDNTLTKLAQAILIRLQSKHSSSN